MKIVSVCDNKDLATGLRLVGVEKLAAEELVNALVDPNVAIVIISREFAKLYNKQVEEARLKPIPLIVELDLFGNY